jgi:hypothetical protein
VTIWDDKGSRRRPRPPFTGSGKPWPTRGTIDQIAEVIEAITPTWPDRSWRGSGWFWRALPPAVPAYVADGKPASSIAQRFKPFNIASRAAQ